MVANGTWAYWNESVNMTRDAFFMNMSDDLPIEMTFNENAMLSVGVYCVLFVIAACGNLTVFITLFRNRHRKSRVNRFILHLSLADLIVTFIMMPLEISWNVTVSWLAGDVMCRVMMLLRAFGFYLSSSILVTISLDRYFAILHPLSMNDADRRGRLMIAFSWGFSFVASIPQVRRKLGSQGWDRGYGVGQVVGQGVWGGAGGGAGGIGWGRWWGRCWDRGYGVGQVVGQGVWGGAGGGAGGMGWGRWWGRGYGVG